MRYVTIAVLAGALGTPLLGGCGDKEVRTEQSKSTNPLTGTVTHTDTTTYQRSDGSTYTDTQMHKSD